MMTRISTIKEYKNIVLYVVGIQLKKKKKNRNTITLHYNGNCSRTLNQLF